ncbi:MAG: xanthine dehydrogenase family protein subunit M [Thermodesulfobacteriota bacterium]
MLRKLREFEYLEPSSLSGVISLLDQHSKAAKILAGGTDLLVDMKQGALSPGYLINIKGIPGQDYIKYDKKGGLRIGALTTIRQIETSRMIREQFLPLAQAAKVLGSVQVRNRATIGGNLCNASPSAETAPPLLVLGAKVKLVGSRGERVLPLEEFFVGSGLTVLDKEILTEIMVPPPPPYTRGVYMSISRRRAVDLALVGVAVAATVDRDRGEWKEVKIALGAVAPTPMRACKAEKILKGKRIEAALMEEAAQMASDEARPISDVRASAWYREEMVRVLVQRALEQVSRN